MSEIKPNKMVSRNVAIALGIICIVLIAGFGGAMLYTVTLLNDKNNQIDSLNTQISTLNSTISSLNSQISQLNSYVTNAAANPQHSKFWFSQYGPARSSEEDLGTVGDGENYTLVPYAGYVKVQIEPFNNNCVRALYNSAGTNFVYQVFTNANGTAIIPVLPTHSMEMFVGNLTIGANYSAAVTYCY